MAHFMGTSPRLLWFSYGDPAALATAFGFFLPRASIWLDFSSIHWSSFDFLKRQRFPSLKAGIFCSPTYLYSVSGLTPRYCEAWRMFITSRESAIVHIPFHRICARYSPYLPNCRANLRRKLPRTNRVRVSFGVQSISQPRKCQTQGVFPSFFGFYGCFL